MTNDINNHDLFISSLENDSIIFPNEKIIPWINERRKECYTKIGFKELDDLKDWEFQRERYSLSHKSGRFFSIEGISVQTSWGFIQHWDQPIINQPEIGILGLLAKKFNNIVHFLVQAKIEPGNINIAQISPTLQATKSNYSRVHGGSSPKYLEFFRGRKDNKVIIDQLHSEQGSRFLQKRNRNIIVAIEENEIINLDKNFIWLTLGQLKKLLEKDNVINMDTRSIISCINFDGSYEKNLKIIENKKFLKNQNYFMAVSALNTSININNFSVLTSWLTEMKSDFDLKIYQKSLKDLKLWHFQSGKLERKDKKYFSVIGVNVLIENREVISWDQPMIKPSEDGVIIFLVTKFKGIYHFLAQAKLEAGNLDKFEIGPTIQCKQSQYENKEYDDTIPFLKLLRKAKKKDYLFDSFQSEEGGRFFQEINRHIIVEIDKNEIDFMPKEFIWISLNQLLSLNKYNNHLNISSRSLLSIIRYS